jgi:Holliday junction resolvase
LKEASMKPGTKLAKQIIQILKANGWWATQVSAHMNTGILDIIATRPKNSLHLEVKAYGDTVRDTQLNWCYQYHEDCGGYGYFIKENKDSFSVIIVPSPQDCDNYVTFSCLADAIKGILCHVSQS